MRADAGGVTIAARTLSGARAMIWHDMLLDRNDPRWKGFVKFGSKLTARLADTLPKDVVVCDFTDKSLALSVSCCKKCGFAENTTKTFCGFAEICNKTFCGFVV